VRFFYVIAICIANSLLYATEPNEVKPQSKVAEETKDTGVNAVIVRNGPAPESPKFVTWQIDATVKESSDFVYKIQRTPKQLRIVISLIRPDGTRSSDGSLGWVDQSEFNNFQFHLKKFADSYEKFNKKREASGGQDVSESINLKRGDEVYGNVTYRWGRDGYEIQFFRVSHDSYRNEPQSEPNTVRIRYREAEILLKELPEVAASIDVVKKIEMPKTPMIKKDESKKRG
jgi:hypothetical protein